MTIFPYFALVVRAFQGGTPRPGSPSYSRAAVIAALLGLTIAPRLGHVAPADAILQSQLQTVTEQVQATPQDPALQLKKGVLLAQTGQTQAAMEIFNNLRRQYPQQAASYINLAALYAQMGRLEDARQMLVTADSLQTDRYTTQLGLAALNLELALQAYDTAMALRPGDPEIQKRRLDLSKLLSGAVDTNASAQATLPRGGLAGPTVTPQGDSASPSLTKQGSKPPRDRLTLSAEIPVTAKKVTTTVTDAGAGNTPEVQTIQRTLDDWATAWSQKSFTGYLAHYSSQYQPGRGLSLAQWTARKRLLIEQAKYIQVEIQLESVRIADGTATVRVLQTYQSDVYADKSRKEIALQQVDGRWKITREKDLP